MKNVKSLLKQEGEMFLLISVSKCTIKCLLIKCKCMGINL